MVLWLNVFKILKKFIGLRGGEKNFIKLASEAWELSATTTPG